MKTFIVFTILVTGCTPITVVEGKSDLFCNYTKETTVYLENQALLVYPDSHGDYAISPICKEKIVAINFSKSGLYTGAYSELYNKMRYNSLHGVKPVEVIVNGTLEVVPSNGMQRTTVIVSKIVSYSLNSDP